MTLTVTSMLAAAIREGHEIQTAGHSELTRPHVIEIEAQHVEQFRVSVPAQDIGAKRREQSLVLAYVEHLRSQERKMKRHMYPLYGSVSALVCDLVDETGHVLYQAKGDVRRDSI